MKFLVIILVLVTFSGVRSQHQNNVCRSLMDYANMQRSLNCWYDPDVDAPPGEIAQHHGFPFEVHEIVTKDGYVLSLFRIPHNGSDPDRVRTPLILQHGFAVDATTWMYRGEQSPAFLLANKGFDVWLPNLRGAKFSQKHLMYSTKSPEFWNFSFHDMGVFDVPAIIDFVSKKTQQRGEIVYVGHSMGTTVFFIYASVRPKHAEENVKTMIALAPVAYMAHARSILKLFVPFTPLIRQISEALQIYSLNRGEVGLLTKVCSTYPGILLCQIIVGFTAGLSADELKFEVLPVYYSQYLSGASLKTLDHFGQLMVGRNGFSYYNYGPMLNMKLYNSTYPPQYKLSRIGVPVHLFYGRKDYLAEEQDVSNLYGKLETKKSLTRVLPNGRTDFSHQDFIIGAHVKELYDMVIEKISSS